MRQTRLYSLAILFFVFIGGAYGQVWTQSFNGTTIPVGWAQSNSCNSTSTNASWKITTSAPGYGASGFIDHTGSTGSYAMWVDGSSPYPCEVSIVTDFIDISTLTSPSIEFFWAKNNTGSNVGNNILEVDAFDGTTYYNVFKDSADALDWQKAVIDLSCNSTVAALDSFAIRFKVIKNSGAASFYNDIIVDDIKVQEKPSCLAPTSLAVSNITTSADVDVYNASCAGPVAATSAHVIYGIIGFDPSNSNSGQTVAATNGSATITGLLASLVYEVYAYNDCGSGTYSDTIGPFQFNTPCGTLSTPFTQTFDGGASGSFTNPSLPNCWEYYSDDIYPYYYVRNLSSYANSGSQMIYGYKTSSSSYGDTAFFATPAIQGLDSATKQVSFYTRTSSASYQGMVIVGVTDANATPSSFKAIDTVYSGLTYQQQIVQLDSSTAISSGDARIAFAWIYDGSLDYVYIDDITVEAIPDCPAPFAPTLVSVGSTTATLSWTSNSSVFYLEYGPTGFTQGNGTMDTASATTHVLTGLSSDTNYDVYIMSDCSSSNKGTSSWSSPLSFKTNCGAVPTPISEDFDGVTAGSFTNPALPNCWQYYSNGTYPYWYVRNYSFYANSGTNMVYGYKSSGTPNGSTYGDTAFFASPEVQGLDSATKMVKFYARTSSTSYTGMIIVGVTDALASPGSFKTIDTVYANTSYAQYQIYLDSNAGITSGDARVAFAWIYDGSFDYVYIDDIEIVDMPPCPEPTAISLVSATSSALNIAWSSPSSNFQVEVGPVGFTQGTGSAVSVSGNSYTITGLDQNTEYDVYVMSDCSGAGNGNSAWIGPITMRTECGDQVAPYYTGFEGFLNGSSVNPDLPYCWTYEKRSTSSSFYAYNYDYALNAYAGINYLYYYGYVSTISSSSAEGDTLAVGSPRIQGLDSNNKEVIFYGRGSTSTSTLYSAEVIVAVTDSNASLANMHIVDTVSMGTSYQQYSVALDNLPSNASRVLLIMIPQFNPASTSSYGYNYFYIDELTIRDIPLCPEPGNIAAFATSDTSAALTWTDSSVVTNYFIEWGPAGFTQGTGAPIDTVAGTSWSVDTLLSNTSYDFYIQSECMSMGVNSPWVGPFTILTPCAPTTVPFTDGFEGSPAYSGNNLNPNLPSCWAYDDDGGTSYTYGYGYSFYALHGSYSLRSYMISGYGDTDLVSTPMIQDIDKGGNVLTFYARTSSVSYPGEFAVVMTDAMGNYKTARHIETIDLQSNTSYQEYQVYLDSNVVMSGDQRVGFMFYSKPATYDYVYIDSVTIDAIPSCISYNHNLVSRTGTSATVDWDYTGNNCFNIEVGLEGFVQGTGTGSQAGTSYSNVSAPYTITGLSSNTGYEYYVENCCNPGVWEGPFAFRTDCAGPLTGTYSVGPTGDFSDLDTVLATIGNCGVSGNVEFTLQPGSYSTARAIVPFNGSGTVTFTGTGSDTITSPLVLEAAENYTFDGLYIKTSGVNSVRLNGTKNIAFENCTIDAGSSTSTTVNAIVASNSPTSIYSTTVGEDHLRLENNTILGGYFGVRLYGSSAGTNDSVVIKNNTIESYYYGIYSYYSNYIELTDNTVEGIYGAYLYYTNTPRLEGNSFEGNTYGTYMYYSPNAVIKANHYNAIGSYGIYAYYSDDFDMQENVVNGSGVYGMYLYRSGGSSSTSRAKVINNMVDGGNSAIYPYYAYYIDFFHNTARGNIGFDNTYSEYLDARNNIFVGSQYGMYHFITSAYGPSNYDYNLLYNSTGSSIVGAIQNVGYSLANLKLQDTANYQNSVSADPFFYNGLHVAGPAANDVGDNTVGVTVDIDGDTRPYSGSTVVDMGADEYETMSDDAGLIAVLNPVGSFCGGDSIMVEAVIGNFGTNTMTSLTVGMDGAGNSLSATPSVNLAFGQSDTVVIGYLNQKVGGTYTLTTYVSYTNDGRASNDTIVTEVQIGDAQQVQPVYDAFVCSGDSALITTAHPTLGNILYTSGSDTVYMGDVSGSFKVHVSAMKTLNATMLSTTDAINNYKGLGTAGSNYTFYGYVGLEFTTTQAGTIDSVTVYPNNAGTISVSLVEMDNISNVYWTGSVSVTATSNQPEQVYLGAPFSAGGSYALVATASTTGGMYREYGVSTYPLSTANGAVTITNGTLTNYHYFFYDWRISMGGCEREDSTFTIDVHPDPVASLVVDTANAVITATDYTANWDASGTVNADSIFVEISNGTTSNATSGSAVFTANNAGETITVIAFGPCTSDTVTYTFDVEQISVFEEALNGAVAVYPNPTRGIFKVDFDLNEQQEIKVELINTLGQVFHSEVVLVNGSSTQSYDLSDQPAGIYFLRMTTDRGMMTKRITVE